MTKEGEQMTIAKLDLPGMFRGLEPSEAKKLTALIVFAVDMAYQVYQDTRARQKEEGDGGAGECGYKKEQIEE